MSLQELKEQAFKLSVRDRLSLISAIIESLQEMPSSSPERSRAIGRMRGLLKTDRSAPTDEEVVTLLEERQVEKYLG
ncbi:MAG: hypothetical protein KME17_22245 [Cyanosarcina radialis HA8281-LM2]|jgi:hypothetical protein|nr:hypothetical protein [Cyanosarcina radialis HA8281-LM2]